MFLLLLTLISMLLAVIMSVVAWRVSQEERRRANARVAALAAEIHGTDRAYAPSPDMAPDWDLRRVSDVPPSTASLFEVGSSTRTGPRLAAVVGIGVLVFGSMASLAVVLGSGSSDSVAGKPLSSASTAPAGSGAAAGLAPAQAVENPASSVTPAPLELVALGHERDGDRLTVRGVVRNPMAGSEIDRAIAVVFLFDRDGGFLASGRAAIDSAALGPGGESTFTVTVPGASNVGRYRVSFRTENRVVPHVDRRDYVQEKS